MQSRKVIISNSTGLHVGPAGILAREAERCSSRVELVSDNKTANCRSLLNILSLMIRKGDEVEIRCTGINEEQDLEHMVHVIENELEKNREKRL